jgi:hypothetical protein
VAQAIGKKNVFPILSWSKSELSAQRTAVTPFGEVEVNSGDHPVPSGVELDPHSLVIKDSLPSLSDDSLSLRGHLVGLEFTRNADVTAIVDLGEHQLVTVEGLLEPPSEHIGSEVWVVVPRNGIRLI